MVWAWLQGKHRLQTRPARTPLLMRHLWQLRRQAPAAKMRLQHGCLVQGQWRHWRPIKVAC